MPMSTQRPRDFAHLNSGLTENNYCRYLLCSMMHRQIGQALLIGGPSAKAAMLFGVPSFPLGPRVLARSPVCAPFPLLQHIVVACVT